MEDLNARLMDAALTGMTASVWADVEGDRIAVYDPLGVRTFRQINEAANRIVRFLRAHGVEAGDAIALLCSNRAEFVEVLSAALRGGFRITPVNWHLTTDEVAYIINDCEAKALFAETRFPAALAAETPAAQVKISIGADAPDFIPYAEALAGQDSSDIPDPLMGGAMLYTSGTTGRPKGVFRRTNTTVLAPGPGAPEDVQMCAGPAYHAAPLAFDVRSALAQGNPLVFLDKWDSEGVLAAIERHRVTRCHLVPIMFQRLLALPEEVKARYDLSSLRYVIHGAAPCPPEVKKAMIDWWGPILHEYYAGSEGGAGFLIDSVEWLAKPGTVGRLPAPGAVKLYDDEGVEITQRNTPGMIYFQVSPIAPFEYFKDPAKTAGAHRGDYFTLGDVGYLDDDDYLFLTGRTAECIISGGVNIYPQEIDNEIIKHPAVEDSCAIGVPNEEWGEEVKVVVTLHPGREPSDALAADILAFARARLATFKAPRSLAFAPELPRSPAGKIQRGKVRAPYWEGRARQI
ncbi:MAG TPA: AMP-binding protein [Caulobacteraceae bacterium]|jgi:long-chain acyl-CoA synthetase|nr:AMP-binding protein [Caulobacteraceae bacterium]